MRRLQVHERHCSVQRSEIAHGSLGKGLIATAEGRAQDINRASVVGGQPEIGTALLLDIPLAQFEGMNFGNVAQLILSGNVGNVWIDNIYFRK